MQGPRERKNRPPDGKGSPQSLMPLSWWVRMAGLTEEQGDTSKPLQDPSRQTPKDTELQGVVCGKGQSGTGQGPRGLLAHLGNG